MGSGSISKRWHQIPLAIASALAAGAIAGWFLGIRTLVQIYPGSSAMVLSTATGCLVACLTLFWIDRGGQGSTVQAAGGGGLFLVLLGMLAVAENVWRRNLGLDFPSLHRGLIPGYVPAGRMGMNSGLVLMFFGVNLLAFAFRRRLPGLSAIRYLLVVVCALSTGAVLTRWFDLSDLFTWYYAAGFNRMSPLTAVTSFLIAIAMWQIWEGALWFALPRERMEGIRILQTAAFALSITALATGTVGITLLQSRLMHTTEASTQRMAADYARTIDVQLTQRVDRASILSNQQFVGDALERLNRNPREEAAAKSLRQSATALLGHGFSAVAFQSSGGSRFGAGKSITDATAKSDLAMPFPTTLLWKAGFFLETSVPVEREGKEVGRIFSQQPLLGLNSLMARSNAAGATWELSLCTKSQGRILCFPQRSRREPFWVTETAIKEDGSLSLALAGHEGTAITESSGRRVLSAYVPIGSLGLALESKVDTAEIFKPTRRGLEIAAPLIVMLIIAASWGMNRRIRPLIQELVSSREHIRHMATHDVLTNLPNRLLLEDRSARALQLAAKDRERIAVIMVDLDHFKAVNDELGHAAGDQLLIEVAVRLKACVRETDTVARFGGDEFVVLIPHARHPEGTAVIANKILETLNFPMGLGNRNVVVTPSVGIAVYPEDGEDIHSLMQHADSAMYRAKSCGGNRVRGFERKSYVLETLPQ